GMGRRGPGCQRANAGPVNENEAVDSSIYDSGLPRGASSMSFSRLRTHLRLRLLQVEPHVHLAVHRRRDGEVFAGLLVFARPPGELAEAKMAVSDERAHAARLGEGQRLAVVGLAALGIEPFGVGRDVTKQVERMGREPGLTRRGLNRTVV